ncbi:DgyrCDS1600 [Dimorphilus gyrociliatus]|uniref:DgyrCDS1600 n=1 Tax=Dimorphilus gyrociliatus TaxID=2664684 RepID=A0A7I8V7R2_9ANNE|nr:DgyrCDS1600 [Dimorphilus gyrociliatus]
MFSNIVTNSTRVFNFVLYNIQFRRFSSIMSNKSLKIGTHDGQFHCDEALACYLLKKLDEYKDAEIVRTRNPDKLADCDIVVDVGAIYDHDKKRYDHHQREFAHSLKSLDISLPYVTKLSSAGLIYYHYGEGIIRNELKKAGMENLTRCLFIKMYENCIEEVDAVDNGISIAEGTTRYKCNSAISSRISFLNPRWNEESSPEDSDKRFESAMKLVGEHFDDRLDYYITSWIPARSIVESAFHDRFKAHESGEILVFTKGCCPWKEHLTELEEEEGVGDLVKFVLFTDQHGHWRVQSVPKEVNSFESRIPLHQDWRGLRDDVLSQVSGIDSCIFVHASGFIGGNKTYEGAIKMALNTIKAVNQ